MATPNDKLQLLTVSEVSKVLQLSVRKVYEMNASGELPAPLRLGRSVRWAEHELRGWIDAGAPTRERWERIRTENGNGIHLQARS